MTTEENFDMLMAKEASQSEENPREDDSDYGGSDEEEDAPTTFRMLLEKVSARDIEFIDRCQHGGLLLQNPSCANCHSRMILVEDAGLLDGVEWWCEGCSSRESVRLSSWFLDLDLCRLKDLLLILYCWSRNYPVSLTQHELESQDLRSVPLVYSKCHKLAVDFFRDEASNIGSEGEIVEIQEFRTTSGIHLIGGVEKKNIKNVFFRVLPENWTRDELITAIVDNIAPKTIVRIQNPTLLEILDKEGLQYLDRVWKINVETSSDEESTLVTSLWALFEKYFLNKDFTECSLIEFLFRRRMEASRDPFLFLLSVINRLHPLAYSSSFDSRQTDNI